MDIFQQNNLFDLNTESILFLDQIFMGDFSSSTEWDDQSLQFGSTTDPPQTATESATDISRESNDEDNGSSDSFHFDVNTARDLWSSCNIDSAAFIAALQAYFDFAALCLPIIFEDAFWKDYGAGKCSDALVYAIACRGMPFTRDVDKWATQQRIASRFKATFLERQQASTTGGGSMRLDIVEALALMVGFQYEQGYDSTTYAHLEALFLSHDSLVMMTLQCRLQDGDASSPDMPQIARAAERRTLLFWHVYGLDAFHSLDQKFVSRIPDEDGESTKVTQQHDSGGYLDAILSLAIIARRIFQKLRSVSSRRKGVLHTDVDTLYEDLKTWQRSCPPHLQKPVGDCNERQPPTRSSTPILHLTLQFAVLWALKINLYLQIESCVAEYGVRGIADAMQGHMVCAQVEHESLHAVQEGIQMLEWMDSDRMSNNQADAHSLTDLSPSIVRDICAGVGVWTCIRGKAILSRDGTLPTPYQIHTKRSGASKADASDGKQNDARSYLQIARRFRAAVAQAVSHKDTELAVGRIDNFMTPLEQELA